MAAAVTAAVLLNLRYGPIGVSVAPWLEGPAWWRFLRAQLVVDESWAVAAEGEGRFDPRILVGAGLLLYVLWQPCSAGPSRSRSSRWRRRGSRSSRRAPHA